MSLKKLAARIAVGAALMVGPIIGCGNQDDYYPYYTGGAASSSGGTSGATYYGDSGAERCEAVAEGVSCYSSRIATSCEQGTNANGNCNPHFVCGNGVWAKDQPQRAVCAPTSACPLAYTETAPDLCKRPDAISLLCEYDEGTCGCAPVGGIDRGTPSIPTKKDAGVKDGGDAGDASKPDAGQPADAGAKPDAGPRTYEWKCVPPPKDPTTDASCPRRRPREGIDCVRPLNCDYGYCVFEDGYRMDCYSGSWVRDLTRSEQCDQ